MVKDEGFGFMYKASIEGKEIHPVGYSFVDDTDIIQSDQPGGPFQVLATHMQSAMDTWEGGIWATGGLPFRNSFGFGRALSHAILHIFPQLQELLHSKSALPCSGVLKILTLQFFTQDTSLPNYWGNSILQ
jgi:hypothetical protein